MTQAAHVTLAGRMTQAGRRAPTGRGAPVAQVAPVAEVAPVGQRAPGQGVPLGGVVPADRVVSGQMAPARRIAPAGRDLETGPRPVRTRARLTRRGRIVVAALITATVVLVAALAWLAGAARADAAGSGAPASAVYHSLRSVVVAPGQSLWSIAVRYDPAADPRDVIQQIIDLNALTGTSLQPGQHLWLPRG
jgi:hypothetical protein